MCVCVCVPFVIFNYTFYFVVSHLNYHTLSLRYLFEYEQQNTAGVDVSLMHYLFWLHVVVVVVVVAHHPTSSSPFLLRSDICLFFFSFCVSCSSFYFFEVCMYLFRFILVYFYRTDKSFPFLFLFFVDLFIYMEMNYSEQGVCVLSTNSPLFLTVIYVLCRRNAQLSAKQYHITHSHSSSASSFFFSFLYFFVTCYYAYSFMVRMNTFSFVFIFIFYIFSLILFHRLALLVLLSNKFE